MKKDKKSLTELLRDYNRRDPDHEEAIRKFVEAEVKYGKDDPMEGKIVIEKPEKSAAKPKAPKR